MKELVLAGNYKEYRDYLFESGKNPKESKYLSREEVCDGVRGITLVKYGTWYNRKDLDFEKLEVLILANNTPKQKFEPFHFPEGGNPLQPKD